MSTIPPEYLSGEKLWGDDFDLERIAQWYRDEAEAYAVLGRGSALEGTYLYAALDRLHAWRHLPAEAKFREVLGLGSARAGEFAQMAHRIDGLTILEPSDQFTAREVHGIPASYVKPSVDGTMPFEDGRFDLAVCFSVLHHIPNVSQVIGELYRTLRPGGWSLVREPTVSMGDWTRPRRGLTPRERGIPVDYMRRRLLGAGFEILHESPCFFSPARRALKLFGIHAYSSRFGARADAICSRLFAFNRRYHATTALQKLAPAAAYFVLRRPKAALSGGAAAQPGPEFNAAR